MIASRFTGRRVLLAVGALAVAAPAAVQIARVAAPSPHVIVVVVPAPTPVVVPAPAPAGVVMMQPRVMRTGAPACGNVTARPIPGVERSCP